LTEIAFQDRLQTTPEWPYNSDIQNHSIDAIPTSGSEKAFSIDDDRRLLPSYRRRTLNSISRF
jgi:hypothetical protein